MAQGPARIASGSSAWVDITGKPSTFPPSAHTQAWSTITTTPTTLSGYGITDAQPLDADLTSIAALTTTSFGRSLLTQADAAAARTTIGAGTSSFNGAYASLTGIPSTFTPAAHNQAWSTITTTPTTLSGYGITDAQGLDSDLTALAGLSTTGLVARTGAGTAAARTVVGTANQVTVTNGDGVSGNPTLSLPQNIATTSTPQFAKLGIGMAAGAGNTIIANNTDSNRVLFAGTTKGIRFTHNSTGSVVEGVDNTGSASHQPLYLGGSYVATSISGTEKMRVDANALSVGASALATISGLIPQVQSTGTTVSGFSSWLFNSAATAQPAVFFNKSASSTIGSHAVVSSSDRLGCFIWAGSDGASYVPASQLRTTVDGTVSSGVVPGKFELLTATAAGALTNKLEVNAAGQLKLNAYGAGTLVTDSSGNVTASSDASLKNVTGDFTRGLGDVLKLTPRTYHWNEKSGMDTDDENVGFVAQEVLKVIPEAVGQFRTTEAEVDGKRVKTREKAELLTLSDRPIIAALVNAVKELSEQNVALVKRITALEMAKK